MSDEQLPRVALALSSGGYGGAGGMTGFAAALDVFMGRHPVGAIGHYSGVSAGSLVATYLAAGVSPLDVIKGFFGTGSHNGWRVWSSAELYRPNYAELRPTATRLARAALRRLGLADPVSDELGILPSGLMSADGIADNIRDNLARRNISRFSDLARRLSVVFYDLVENTRVVAGNGPGEHDLAIADAVAASAAIPGVFPPRRIDLGGRIALGVDGAMGGYRIGVRDLDEVDLVIAYDHATFAPLPGKVSHISAPTVVNLSLQMQASQGNLDEIVGWMDSNPSAHAWVFQPPPRDMRSTFAYDAIFSEAHECYQLGLRWLREHIDYFGVVLADHGVTVDPDFDRVTFEDVKAHGSEVKPTSVPQG